MGFTIPPPSCKIVIGLHLLIKPKWFMELMKYWSNYCTANTKYRSRSIPTGRRRSETLVNYVRTSMMTNMFLTHWTTYEPPWWFVRFTQPKLKIVRCSLDIWLNLATLLSGDLKNNWAGFDDFFYPPYAVDLMLVMYILICKLLAWGGRRGVGVVPPFPNPSSRRLLVIFFKVTTKYSV